MAGENLIQSSLASAFRDHSWPQKLHEYPVLLGWNCRDGSGSAQRGQHEGSKEAGRSNDTPHWTIRLFLGIWFTLRMPQSVHSFVGRVFSSSFRVRELCLRFCNRVDTMEELITIQQVANYLRVDRFTVYRFVIQQRIPAFNVGGQWRFKQEMIDSVAHEKLKHERRRTANDTLSFG